MVYSWLADGVVVCHALFVAFVAAGGLLVWRWPTLAWVHLPALAWGVAVEAAGWVCPLTPLEQWLRGLAGEAGYAGGFIDYYLLPLLYPPGLTRPAQWALAAAALAVNGVVYGLLLQRRRRR